MEWIVNRSMELSFSELSLKAVRVGDDILAWISGGDRPHIGCTVQSVPRLSLTGDGSVSTTSSVLNITGHKDEMICKKAAEALCVRYQAVTVCCGGFHIDHINSEQILEVLYAVDRMLEEM